MNWGSMAVLLIEAIELGVFKGQMAEKEIKKDGQNRRASGTRRQI